MRSRSVPKVYCRIGQCSVCGGAGTVVVSCLLQKDGTVKPLIRAECIACDGRGRRVIEFGGVCILKMKDVPSRIVGKTHFRLIAFLHREEFWGSELELAKRIGVSYPTLRKAVRELSEEGLVRQIKIGRSILVVLNRSSPLLKSYIKFIDCVSRLQRMKDGYRSDSRSEDSEKLRSC